MDKFDVILKTLQLKSNSNWNPAIDAAEKSILKIGQVISF